MAERQGIGDLKDLVVGYAKQEIQGPLEGTARWLGFGVLGSILLMIGGVSLTLALLRFLQEEAGSWVTGNLSWLPYVITLTVLLLTTVLLGLRINKRSL